MLRITDQPLGWWHDEFMKCKIHPDTELICPRCFGAKGGKKSQARLTRAQRSDLGKSAARAKKEKASQTDRDRI